MKRRVFLKAPALGIFLPAAFRFDGLLQQPHRTGVQGAAGDPAAVEQRLHQDFSTYAPGVEYFLLGNGDLQAVLQYVPDRSGDRPQTFLGLTLMDAERFARKWSTLLFHPENGFQRTMLVISIDAQGYAATPETLSSIGWKYTSGVPSVSLVWKAGGCVVEEEFVPSAEGAILFREVTLENRGANPAKAGMYVPLVPSFALFDEIGPDGSTIRGHGFADIRLQCLDASPSTSGRYDMNLSLGAIPAGRRKSVRLAYTLRGDEKLLPGKSAGGFRQDLEAYWSTKHLPDLGNAELNHLYAVSRTGLKAHVARSGKRDSGYWMYNMEWVRDDVMVAMAMVQAGFHDEARTLFSKLLKGSVGPDGRTIESSRWFGYDYTELDQNGELLYGLWMYLSWTGDQDLIRESWEKIRLVADFVLQPVFWNKTVNMVRNKREFWERSDSFGVQDGYELAYQVWVYLGLERAATMATHFGDIENGARWRRSARAMLKTMLGDPHFKLLEDGHFIKRRTVSGEWQRYMIPPNRKGMPPGSPIATEEKPECEPESAEAFPIIHGLVDARGPVAGATLAWIEKLWNQRWDFGGYSRYNVSSEPDPPAPWPLVGVLMAQAYAEAGNSEKVWRVVHWLNTIHGGKSGGWFERYGPSITPPAPPVCVIGWTWAEIVTLVVRHLMGVRPGIRDLVITPHLLDGVNEMRGTPVVQGSPVDLTVRRAAKGAYAVVNGSRRETMNGSLRILLPAHGDRIAIEMYC